MLNLCNDQSSTYTLVLLINISNIPSTRQLVSHIGRGYRKPVLDLTNYATVEPTLVRILGFKPRHVYLQQADIAAARKKKAASYTARIRVRVCLTHWCTYCKCVLNPTMVGGNLHSKTSFAEAIASGRA